MIYSEISTIVCTEKGEIPCELKYADILPVQTKKRKKTIKQVIDL